MNVLYVLFVLIDLFQKLETALLCSRKAVLKKAYV